MSPNRMWLSACLVACATWTAPAGAHAQSDAVADRGAGARVEAQVGLSEIRGSVAGLFGGAVFVGLGRRTWLGGAGYVSSQVEFADPVRGASQLGMGYGGLAVELEIGGSDLGTWSVAALVGGGNADASDPVVGVEVGSDNFFVVQSSVRLRRLLRGPVGIAGEAGYRRAFGVQDIAGVGNSSLSGATVGVSIYALRR